MQTLFVLIIFSQEELSTHIPWPPPLKISRPDQSSALYWNQYIPSTKNIYNELHYMLQQYKITYNFTALTRHLYYLPDQ